MRKDSFRRVIEKVLEEEAGKHPSVKKLPEGQKKVVKETMLEKMVYELTGQFFDCQDPYFRLQLLRFFADYSGQKPVDVKMLEVNPYAGMSEEELEAEQRKLLEIEDDEG